jgi:rhomboid protease GluP
MVAFARASEGERIYPPRRAKPCAAALMLILLAVAAGFPERGAALHWLHGEAVPSSNSIVTLISALGCFGVGMVVAVGALRGRPRLIVTPAGVTLETLYGTKWADWSSLAAFELTTRYVGPLWRSVRSATARITGTGAGRSLLRSKKMVIPDAFLMPIETIAFDLNQRRERVPGAAAAAVEPAEAVPAAPTGTRVPWLTFVILAVLVAAFIGERRFAVQPTGRLLEASPATLLALGGLNRTAVLANGEWYRLFTAPLLHLDLTHLALNGIALVMAGFILERLVGRLWFLSFFVVGALGGSLASLAVNPGTVTSVGASGAIMGLFAAAFTSSFRLPAGSKARWWAQMGSIRVLVPSLLPLATATSGAATDYGAHFGGAVSGVLLALLLVRKWPMGAALPPFRRVAACVATLGVVVAAASTAAVAHGYPKYRILVSLIPREQIPHTAEEIGARADTLLARYPLDPRSRMYHGIALAAAKDYEGAERETRSALRQAEELRFVFVGPEFADSIRLLLAAILQEAGKQAEAREAARPLCQAAPGNHPNAKIQHTLDEQHLCD